MFIITEVSTDFDEARREWSVTVECCHTGSRRLVTMRAYALPDMDAALSMGRLLADKLAA